MVDPETHNNLILLAGAVMFVLARLAWRAPCLCEKCAFHQNEARMKRLKRAEETAKYKKDQAALRHDYEHKGGGFRDGDPDRFNCPDDQCPRNPRKSTLDL